MQGAAEMHWRIPLSAVVLSTAALSVGCATLDIPWFHSVPEASAKNPVVKILCLWEPSEGRDPNGLPCRGFAGQVLFLGNHGGTPVKVQGDVAIYVFDDFGTPEEQARPLHVFEFKGGSWDRHLKVGTFGPAYHVFVPYTRPGGYEANCSLRIKLTPYDGAPVVYSDPSNLPLKGKPRPFSAGTDQGSSTASESGPKLPPPPQVRTTSIPLDHRNTEVPASPLADERTRHMLESLLQSQLEEPSVSGVSREPNDTPRIRFDGRRVKLLKPETATGGHVSTEHPLYEHTGEQPLEER
jgi:hypothetical protein